MAASPHHLGVLIESSLERHADNEVLFFEGTWHRASDQLERQRRLTGGLIGLGIRPGERVVVLMSNSPDVGVLYGAIWRAGAVVTPVVFLLTEIELRHVLADSEAAAIVTTPEFLPKVAAAADGVETLRHIVLLGDAGDADGPGGTLVPFEQLITAEPADVVARADDDLGALMYTGGTTGRSKGVMLSHANLFWCGKASYEKGMTAGMDPSRSLIPLPLSHAYGMIVTVVGAFREGAGQATLMRWFDPAGWLQLAQDHRIENAPLVPSMLTMLLQQPLEEYDLSAMKYVLCGSAPLSVAALEEWERRVPSSMVLNGYGCTESGSVIATSTVAQRKVGTVGTPIPYLDVQIRDDDGRPLPRGEIGEVCCKGPGVMQGYWKAPDVTATALRDGWLHTGDVGVIDEEGFLTLVDRKKDLIIRGGFNVYPRDVEDELMTHPSVAMAAVIGRPDEKMGEEVVAFVSLRPDMAVTSEDLVAYAKERLAANKYPREVHILDAIPLTSVGKTDRKALRRHTTD
jgi:long-chain acyl-CoA synthetase